MSEIRKSQRFQILASRGYEGAGQGAGQGTGERCGSLPMLAYLVGGKVVVTNVLGLRKAEANKFKTT